MTINSMTINLENNTAEETAIEVLNNSNKYETVEIRIAYYNLMNDKSCSLDTKYHLCYKLKILYKERLEGRGRKKSKFEVEDIKYGN